MMTYYCFTVFFGQFVVCVFSTSSEVEGNMNPVIAHNAYGKGQVRFTKLKRLADRHEVLQITSNTELEGDFARSYTHGDNTLVVATDSIRNTTYALASDHPLDSLEEFGYEGTTGEMIAS